MNFIKSSSVIFLTFFVLQIQAQTNTDTKVVKELSLDSGTIESQFEFITKKSTNWRDARGQNFEVVRVNWVAKLKKNTLDSLKAAHKTLSDTKATVARQNQEISKLKTSLTTAQNTLENSNTEKDSMSLFGLQMSKIVYNGLMWTVIACLLALTLFFMFRFKNSNSITKAAKRALLDTEEEFETHRRIAVEREQKVRRQLQDEIIKNKNN